MAEEVPVSDVLCNATEYLCKLGSNLRSRSENLKQKRISKDKLRNAHAVRKAATKLLLMCELSKKSLENVENGVKRVLTIVDASRCSPSVGAKTKNQSPKQQNSNKEFFYFEHDSCKLRISKKILLKHYTSVKVHAKSMPATMMDKYPVHYNCSLYQKRKEMKGCIVQNKDKIEAASIISTKKRKENRTCETGHESEDEAKAVESDDTFKTPKRGDKSTIQNKNEKTILESESEGGSKSVNKDKDNLVSQPDNLININKKKFKSETSTATKSKRSANSEPSENVLDTKNELIEKSEVEEKIEDKSEKPRKSKSVRFLDESSDSSHKESVEGNDRKKCTLVDKDACNEKKAVKTDKIVDLVDDDCMDSSEKTEKSHEVEENIEKDEDNESELQKKPMIKLVSLNKLLKPDVIQKLDGNSNENIEVKQTNIKTYENRKQRTITYFLEKKKEVSAFKPKNFNVVVARLPKFSDNFLSKYGLKKIMQGGYTVYHVSDKLIRDSDSPEFDTRINQNRSTKSRKNSKDISDPNMDKKKFDDGVAETKNALLNSDSDSSNSIAKSPNVKTTEKTSVSKTKDALLNSDSDSSNSKSKAETKAKGSLSKIKDASLNSDSDGLNTLGNKNKLKTSKQKSLLKTKDTLLNSDSGSSDNKNKSKASKSNSLSTTKDALLDSDSDSSAGSQIKPDVSDCSNSNTKPSNIKTAEKKIVSQTKDALLNSDSDSSSSKSKPETKQKDSLSKTKDALLKSDSDSSDTKKKQETSNKDYFSRSKSTLLDSDSDSSVDKKKKPQIKRKKSLSKTKTALLNSDSDNSDNKKKTGTDTLSKTKNALLDSDSESSCNKKKLVTSNRDSLYKTQSSDSNSSDNKDIPDTSKKDSLSKTKDALLDFNSDSTDSNKKPDTSKKGSLSESKRSDSYNSESKKKPETPKKDALSKTKDAVLDSDSSSSGSKKKSGASKKNSLSENPVSGNTNEKMDTFSCGEDKSGEQNNESSDSSKDKPDKNGKGNISGGDETNSLKSTEPSKTPSKRKLIMESMQAKKMLLTYFSSSDSDDEQFKSTMKNVRNSLLNASSSSDDEINVKEIIQANRRQLATPSDSDNSLKKSKTQTKSKKDLSKEKVKNREENSIGQFDGTNDEHSDTSSSQMGRSKTKVASGSNQSSETVDSNDIEINRLADLKSLNRPRRRRDSGDKAEPRSTRRMPKAPLIEEEALGPESSDAASMVESDAGDVEELPPVSLEDLNGDGINHLAKEDLLAHSDSSSSQNDKENGSEDDKKEESEEEENVKSIRRKPNAISSDSEAGSSRRKAERVSDFEESESDSEPRKKTKRKKKGSDSDASQSSNDGSKKKRRRIKQVNDSDGSGSDTETEGKNKHGRKNIRKVMSKDQLEEATKKAARQEKERIARIAERQKLYNNLEFDESGKPDEVVLEKVVLDFDPDTKEPLIELDRGLVKKLKPHQANGIKFMWNACFESVKRIKKDRGSGCILAHCMGLGKTLQVVSLTHTLLTHSALTGVRRVLVVCPLSTVLNWVNEFSMWLKHAVADYDVDVFELSRHKQNSERAWQLQQWVESGGVCVLGYEMFRNLSADNNKKFKKKMLKTFQEALVDPGPDLVVCDEGHLLKNEKTSLSQSMNRVRTLRRIVLTGTPLQNNLKEYYCMVQFVKPNLLGKYNEYLNRFVNPITNGQYTDSTERDISIMKRRSHVLHTMLDGAVQRRDYGVLAPFLPPKHEFVLFITLTDIQIKLYQHYLDNYSRRPLPGKSSGFLFPDFQSLQRIWTHPLVLKYNSERYEIMQQKKRDKEEEDSEGSIADFIDDDSTPEESSTEESSDDLSDMSDDSRKKSKKKKSAKKGKGKDSKATGRRGTRANPVELAEEDKPNSDIEEVKYENPTEWWMKLVTDEELEDIRHSHKLLLLFDILRQCEAIGDKLLVFSQSLYSLDLIEHFLGKVDEATQEARIDEKLAGHVGSWAPGVDYFRLDGSTSCENRSIWCKNFNREDNPRARLFLISTRAGGLGINLVAANRVVIFDVSWNPSHDVQSIFRVYRFGQKKPCYIYRFLAMGTMEEKIYERQVTKQAISKRVIDEQQIDRHYAANDLAELYKFEPVPAEPRPVPSLPKDRLFAEMLKDHEKQIFRFHEHDSLLENKEEETLSEEERKRAWEEFENEKRAPPPAPFASSWTMHNGMASLLQQQQQQLAYTALAAMIRKDMPNINDNQLRDMLPIICNANPGMFGGYDYGLMQKMNEIYKYAAQPGMMNPSMMNPVMNPASGMSTSSSLQYEPPWQRQQQQQQQMRLQQLMQQQHSMGAKYYAGGLGSRDPVAMALQQQRAREFLLGGGAGGAAAPGAGAGAGRPRGRPPLQPRAPQAADVVNLADSD